MRTEPGRFYMAGRVVIALIFLPHLLHADENTAPIRNNGKKWNIAYYEGGPWTDYADTMRTLVEGLSSLGWLDPPELPRLPEETPKPYWDRLCAAKSDYLRFLPENAYSAGWDDARRQINRRKLLHKLQRDEIDLVLAAGTWAGLDIAVKAHDTPAVVISTSDPVSAGIIKSAADSGLDHVTARVDPDRYVRQIRMFHRIVGFHSLGVAYEKTPLGKFYSAMDEVSRMARERGFSVVTCGVPGEDVDVVVVNRECLHCYRYLAKNADAVYVTAMSCGDRLVEEIAEIFREMDTPSFSMIGSKHVKRGLLMSISSDAGYRALGIYTAGKIARIFHGATPRTLPQVFRDPLDIAVNLKTAEEIGFPIPKSILKIAHEVYGEQ